jgi:hypothetical protein
MDDIKSLSKRSKKEIEEDLSSKNNEIYILKQDNIILKQKIEQLESFLASQNVITNEELICIEQIGVLKSKSTSRELSLDEVKRLDILIKNLRLIKNQSTDATDEKDYRNVKEADLVAIARRIQEDDQ